MPTPARCGMYNRMLREGLDDRSEVDVSCRGRRRRCFFLQLPAVFKQGASEGRFTANPLGRSNTRAAMPCCTSPVREACKTPQCQLDSAVSRGSAF